MGATGVSEDGAEKAPSPTPGEADAAPGAPDAVASEPASSETAIATVGVLVNPWSRPTPYTVIGRRPTLGTPEAAQ